MVLGVCICGCVLGFCVSGSVCAFLFALYLGCGFALVCLFWLLFCRVRADLCEYVLSAFYVVWFCGLMS